MLQRQAETIDSLGTEALKLLRLQVAVVSALSTGLSVFLIEVEVGRFVPPTSRIDSVGPLAIGGAMTCLFGVFLLVPRPHTDRTALLAEVQVIPPIRAFRLPVTAAEPDACLAWNQRVIDHSQRRLLELVQLNVAGFALLAVWLGLHLVV